ncbi:LOW QUALITY PROTEIN: uncharacterized PE-PGRS family protein PE_PGRS44-like [Falco cherrug]|uniref:LOW QUALITY PROTEIN: uncharacterized PE-PGRS family protein PE_PGRS44-like n=1 Tax=Falco cherrug TaxID=345164 RepID=UPI002479511B|nr:LOW QUALITY PROTEIN: uncharacterized PE-PGRS family protein PE_PGRS44-like [Falco cherrug]
MGRRGAVLGGGAGGRLLANGGARGPAGGPRQPMGGRAGGGAATCCGVANVGPRRAALGPGGWRRGGSGGRGGSGRLSALRRRTEEGELQRPPGRGRAARRRRRFPSAGTRSRLARWCPPARPPVDAGALSAVRPAAEAMLRAAEQR